MSKVKEFGKKEFNGLEQKDSERELYEIITKTITITIKRL